MPKLYIEGPDCTWVVPGKQTRTAIRVDVPSSPAELVDWLNARRVPEHDGGEDLTLAEIFANERPQPKPKPGTLAEKREQIRAACEAAGIDLEPKAPGQCPACLRTAEGALILQRGNELAALAAWLQDLDLDGLGTIQRAAELLGERARELGGRIDEGGNA